MVDDNVTATPTDGDMSGFDTTTRSEEGVWMQARFADGSIAEGKRIRVLGKHSAKMRRFDERNWDGRRGRRNMMLTGAELQDLPRERAVHASLELQGFTGYTGSQEDVRRLYKTYPLLVDQVTQFLDDEANFSKASETS